MQGGMHWIGNQDGTHWKPGWNALETRMECIGNQEGMHWKPGLDALETRMECIGNQEGMHWKPGWNALETRMKCIGNHRKLGWNVFQTGVGNWECIETRIQMVFEQGNALFPYKTTPVFLFGRNIRAWELTDSSTKNGLKTKRNLFGKPMDGFFAGNPLHFPW